MAKLQIGREILKCALDRAILTEAERATLERLLTGPTQKERVAAEISQVPPPALRSLLDDNRLSPNQRAVIVMHVHGMSGSSGTDRDHVYQTAVGNPVEFGSTFAMLGTKTPEWPAN